MLKFSITNQTIKRVDETTPVAGSSNYLVARFEFTTTEWDGLNKTAIFTGCNKTKHVILTDNACIVPWETIKDAGVLTVSLVAGSLITANTASVEVIAAGYNSGTAPSDPTQDVYTQIIERLDAVDGELAQADELVEQTQAYATAAEGSKTSAAASATTATQKATEASNSAQVASQYATAAQSAKTGAEDAQTNAQTAQAQAEEARDEAVTYAGTAQSAATTATSSSTSASNSASSALQAKTSAELAKDDAVIAKNAAETARAAAQTAAQSAETGASTATSAAQSAQTSRNEAGQAATYAGQAASAAVLFKNEAEAAATTAQTAATNAEASAQSVSGLAEQIATNTSNISQLNDDIAELDDNVEHLHKEVSDIWRTIHDEHPNDLKEIQRIVQDGEAQNVFMIGDQIEVPWVDTAANITYSMPFDIVAFRDVELEDGSIVPGMYLQAHYASTFGIQFSGNNAFYYAEDGLPAGTYYFTIGTTWGKCIKDKSYYFTISEDLEAGGQLLIGKISGTSFVTTSGMPDTDPSLWRVGVYASNSAVNYKEFVALAEGTQGTSLGTLSSITKWSDNTNIWNLQASAYGYNRWKDSALRQYLNSGEDKSGWWNPKHKFDRRPDELTSKDGFLKGFNADFLDVIKPVKVKTACNYITDGGTSAVPIIDMTYDKFFVTSLEEEYCEPQIKNVEGSYYPYWKDRLGIENPQKSGSAYALTEHVRYALNAKTSPQHVRLRSAFRGYACSACFAYSSGYVYTYGAAFSIRFAPVCVIC